MKLPRRTFLHLATGAVALPAVSHIARAEGYPTRPVHFIVAFAPGGTADILARLLGQRLLKRLGQPFIVENRPGAGTNIGTEWVVRAVPDGYTLLVASASNAVNQTLYQNLNFNFERDIAPVASIERGALVLVASLSFPTNTVPELIAYAKANPGKVNYASGGIGTATHVSGALLAMMAGIDIVHVPYRGGEAPALIDVIGGQVQIMFANVPPSIGQIKAGKLRALAVTTAARSQALPDIPTVGEFVPGYEASVWYGICAPKNTPTEIIEKLNTEINTALVDPAIKAHLADLGGIVSVGSPAEFRKFITGETEKWGKVIRAANIKAE